jgi:hypothetical protein
MASHPIQNRKMSMQTNLTLSAVSDIEKLAQKRGSNTVEERFKVVPDYAYPNTRLNREELRQEMNKKSAYFHDLADILTANVRNGVVGQLSVEILQCFGLPKPDLIGETSAFCIAVCGNTAFKTDVMPPVANPMWLCKMRRACAFPIQTAYDRLNIGIFGQSNNDKKDGFAGRVVVDISRLRPECTYDVTLPLRESAQVYSRHQRGAIRFRFHLHWYSERAAMLSYLPKRMPKIAPNESVTIQCGDAKSFQNVARVVHGNHMPGRFTMKQLEATIREINFTRIHVLRYMRKREFRDTMQWQNPAISGFVFAAWMHSVYTASVAYLPGHLLTFLLLHLWKNYAVYAMDSPVQNGFQAATWEEMFLALTRGTNGRSYIEPLEMTMKDESLCKSAIQDMTSAATTGAMSHRSAEFNKLYGQEVSLQEIARAFRKDVKVKQIRYRATIYHKAFCGSDAVDFLVSTGYADSRETATALGARLAKELKLFEHVRRKHEFKDSLDLYYIFLAYDANQYAIKTHRPWGKRLFRLLGFMPEVELTEMEAHMEMPYSEGVDHPRFTVKESLVIRSKESQRLLSQAHTMDAADAAGYLLNSTTGQSTEQLAKGFDDFLEEENEKNDEDTVDQNRDEDNEEEKDKNKAYTVEIEILKKPPQQNIEIKKKGDKKLTDILAEARKKLHGVLLHAFNDRVYKIEEGALSSKVVEAICKSKNGSPARPGLKPIPERIVLPVGKTLQKSFKRKASKVEAKVVNNIAATSDEYDKLLGTGKYSHGNPWVAKVAVIVQPIVEIALEWLCLFRALFNVFTWRDPILSFWISTVGPFVVIVSFDTVNDPINESTTLTFLLNSQSFLVLHMLCRYFTSFLGVWYWELRDCSLSAHRTGSYAS